MPAQPLTRWKPVVLLGADVATFVVALYASFLLRFEGSVPSVYLRRIPTYLLIAAVVKLASFAAFRLYRLTWRFASIHDVLNVARATLVAAVVWGVLARVADGIGTHPSIPISVVIVDALLTFLGVATIRMALRLVRAVFAGDRGTGLRTLVVGAGEAAELFIREMTYPGAPGLLPIGLIDDDPGKAGTRLHGVPVLGDRSVIGKVIREEAVTEVVVTMPSSAPSVIREVVVAARAAGVSSIRVMPGTAAVLDGRIAVASVREVQPEDLLSRTPIQPDMTSVGKLISGRTVLVTGAAGSVGTELCYQVPLAEPSRLVLLEWDESRLFELERELSRQFPGLPLSAVVADVKDAGRVARVFDTFRPDVVFHAAAYKHVPMMEAQPDEAVKNNILGTKVVADAAMLAGVGVFLLISTDKAVNPTSVMGASKRVAEMVVRRCNEVSKTRFAATRFGNVLGSRGSLIPILQEQIRRGGPVTITDPAMERYFMTIREAVTLILKAASHAEGGEVFLLDMGSPIKIVDLAQAMIRLSGLEPDVDIPIQFIGKRPGEKLVEEILLAEEGVAATKHEGIFTAKLSDRDMPADLDARIEALAASAEEGMPNRIRELLAELVPTGTLQAL